MPLIKKRNGKLEELDLQKILKTVNRACKDLEDVDPEEIRDEAAKQLFHNSTSSDIEKALIITTSSKIEFEPNYSYVAARLLLRNLYKEAFGCTVIDKRLETQYQIYFVDNIEKLVKEQRLSEKFLEIDLRKLSDNLKPERDLKFKYMGLQTLYDRYFLSINERRMETPQAFFMRVAIGLCIGNVQKEFYNDIFPYDKVIKFYDLISSFKYIPSTPTLFNSGSINSQLSSCYLSTMEDSIDGIYGTLHQQARLSKFAGGLGVDVTPLRGNGGYIKGTNGQSGGYIPWIKNYDSMTAAVDQGGKRKGALAIYSEPWHLDFEEYLELLKNTGDDRRRARDLHTVIWMNDLFLQRVEDDADWYLFCPSEATKLHDLHGKAFEEEYNRLEQEAEQGKLKHFKKLKAKDLWRKILRSLDETGHPWITFKDSSNASYMQPDQGTIHQTNLCTEIFRHNIADNYDGKSGKLIKTGETAVCNLGSINLNEYETEEQLANDIPLMIEMLDNVITNNYYPIESAYQSNMKHRPIGLGLMGFQDSLHKKGLSYNSKLVAKEAGQIQELIAFNAIRASIALAEKRQPFPTYKTSEWAKGIFPHEKFSSEETTREKEWNSLREDLKKYGIRNASIMAIAPTATISYIAGCRQSIEPDFCVLHVCSTLSGEFTIVDEYFVNKCKAMGIWSKKLLKQVKLANGNLVDLDIPQELKDEFPTAFQVDYHNIIDCAAARQKWLDMGQSLNLYTNKKSMKYLSDMYMYAWKKKLKSTYYLRNEGASKVEKSTVEKDCSLEAKRRGEICESCS